MAKGEQQQKQSIKKSGPGGALKIEIQVVTPEIISSASLCFKALRS